MANKEIINEINALIWANKDKDGSYGVWQKYIDFGDASEVIYNPSTKNLKVYFEGKAYGDSHTNRGEVEIMSDFSYSDSTPRFHTNWRGEYTINVGKNYVCNKIYRYAIKKGLDVKSLAYEEYCD